MDGKEGEYRAKTSRSFNVSSRHHDDVEGVSQICWLFEDCSISVNSECVCSGVAQIKRGWKCSSRGSPSCVSFPCHFGRSLFCPGCLRYSGKRTAANNAPFRRRLNVVMLTMPAMEDEECAQKVCEYGPFLPRKSTAAPERISQRSARPVACTQVPSVGDSYDGRAFSKSGDHRNPIS